MALIHVAALRRRVPSKADRANGEYLMMGTWIDEDNETVRWQNTSGKPTFHEDWVFHWGGATYTKELIGSTVYPWLVNTRAGF